MFPFAPELNAAGWLHIVFFGVLVPLLMVITRKTVPSRSSSRLVQTTMLTIMGLAAASLVVARAQGISLFPSWRPSTASLLAGAATYVASVAFVRLYWQRTAASRDVRMRVFVPTSNAELAWWIAGALTAGICEEITWRGVQWALIGALSGNLWIAALLCSLSFTLTHMAQGWRAALVIFAIAMAYHGIVWLSGSLYVAMVVHFAYDATMIIENRRLGRERGYGADSVSAAWSPSRSRELSAA